jgi:hypothetical protein
MTTTKLDLWIEIAIKDIGLLKTMIQSRNYNQSL